MRLLLAEDERELSAALQAVLKRNHYEVDAVYDGGEAYDYLQTGNYDGFILDVMMPVMDGFTLLKKIRNERNNVPVLMLTARAEVDDRVQGLDLGADDYLRSGYKNCDKSWKRDQFVVKRIYGVRMSDAESEYRNDEAAD